MRIYLLILALTASMLSACGGGNVDAPTQDVRQQRMAASVLVENSSISVPGIRSAYTIKKAATGYQIINTADGTVKAGPPNLKRIHFADISLALDLIDAGKIYRLYQAAFDRKPDLAGFSYWLAVADDGYSLLDIATQFIRSEEFQQLYGAAPTDRQFVIDLYDNILHRAPDADGLNYWVESLRKGVTRPQALVFFSEGAENIAQVAPAIEEGITYAKADTAYAPVANAGPDQQRSVGSLVQLDGGDSTDANGDRLSFAWSLLNPDGTVLSLPAISDGKTAFVPGSPGTYTATLKVNDGVLFSLADKVVIVVGTTYVPPIADTGTYKCSSISNERARELFNQGHTYLDRDNDGKPCEASDLKIEAATPLPPSTGMCYVNGYYRKNGTYVRGYWRRC